MNRSTAMGHIAAFLTILVWGVTFVSTKTLLEDFTPFEILFIRFCLGWLALWLLCPLWLPWQGHIKETIFASAGFFGVTIYFLLENMALTMTMASNVAVLVTVAPFFTAMLEYLCMGGQKPPIKFFAGFILALSGVYLLVFKGTAITLNPLGDCLAIMAAGAWAVYTLLTRKLAQEGYGSLVATRRVFFYGLIFMLPILGMEGFGVSINELVQPVNAINLLFLGIGASAICFASWTFAIRKLGASRASAYIYLVPVVTVFTAHIILGESLTLAGIAGAAMTLCGLALAEGGDFFPKKLSGKTH